MTIRSGGRPRDPRAQPGAPVRPRCLRDRVRSPSATSRRAAAATAAVDGGGGAVAADRRSSSSSSSRWSSPASSLSVALTALRPVVNSAVLAWAEDNPAALELPVRRGHRPRGPRAVADHAGLDRADPGRIPRRGRRHGTTIAARLEEQGLLARPRAFVFIATDRRADRVAPAGDVHPAQEHDARTSSSRRSSRRPRSSTSTSACAPACGSSRSPPSSRRCRWRWTRTTSTTWSRAAAGR